MLVSASATLISLACASGCGASQQQSARLPAASLDRILHGLTQAQSSGAVALLRTTSGVWRGAAGHKPGGAPVGPDDRFGIESVTKTFVAALVLQLVEEGRLRLDDTVERWLPRRVRGGKRITIRELLNHTSGLASGMPTEFQPIRDQSPLLFPPGTSESYANLNYAVLGAVVEKVTRRRLDRVVVDRIFRPLQLTSSSYGPTNVARRANPPAWLGAPELRAAPVSGDVGIVSTTTDVAAFYSALLRGAVVARSDVTTMKRTVGMGPHPQAGLGLFRYSLRCGTAWGHGGNDNGYSDQVLASPDGSTVVVVAQNTLNESATTHAAVAIYCAAR
jgi:D-alanyl-D-alanine carboxypeptidase